MNTPFFSTLSVSSGVPLDMQNTDDLRSRDELVEKIDPSLNPDINQWDVSPDLSAQSAEDLPNLSNPDESLRRFASYAFNAGSAEREKAREKKLATMRDIVLYYDGDEGARERLRQTWGDADMERLEALDQEGKLPELSIRLLETYGDGDYRRGGDNYLSDNDLWQDKEAVGVAGIWNHFKKQADFMVQAEKKMRELREREHANLSDAAKRYVLGGEKALGAEERLGLFNAGVDFASLNRVRRAASYIDRYVQNGSLFNDQMADELAEILGNDQDARTMFGRILFEKSRDTAEERKGVREAPRIAEEVYEQQSGVERALTRAGEYMIRTTAAIPAAKSGAWNNFRRSMETYRQNLKNTGKEEMNPFEADRLREHFRKQGLNSEEIARRIADIQFEREKKKEARIEIESLMASALEGGEEEYFKNASFLNRTSYKLGGLVGDWVPMAVPYAGWHLMFGSAAQRSRMEGANLGLDSETRELRSLFRGASAATVEKMAFGGLGKMVPGFSKIQQWAGRGRPASWRARFASSPKAQLAGHALMGMAEEAFLEPTAEYIMNSTTDLFLNDERGKATFSGYIQGMEAMLEPDQFAALTLFSVGMSSLNYGQLQRDSAQFRDMLAAYKASGGTEAGLLDAMKQPDKKSVLQKATENLHSELLENPQEARERAKEAGREMLSGERIESLRELDAWRAAEAVGMVPRVEPAEQEGMFRVYAPSPEVQREDSTATDGQQPESGQPPYTLMDGEQTTAYLQAFVDADMENTIVRTQNMLAGDVMVNQALAQKRFDAAEVITRTVVNEKTGKEEVVIAPETLGQMKARADMAMAAIRALEAEGVSYEEAAARIDASLSEHIPLGTLVQTWDEAQERIRTEQARNPDFEAPAMDAPFSRAYVTNVRRGDTFRRILRYARGSATVEDLMEETMEQAVISWQAEQNTTWEEFGTMLQAAQKSINDLFPEARGKDMQFIHLDAGKPVTGHDAIEAFSKIGRSRWLADALNNTSLPSWLRKLLNHLVKFLGAFKARVELGEMVRQAEEQGVFTLPVRQALAVMLDAGNALYRDQQGDLIALTMERAKAQAELDAALGGGVATEQETVEEQLAERNAADEPGPVDRTEEEADDEDAQQARRERTEAEVEMLGERDDDGVFNGGVSIRIEDGVRQGFIDKDRLTLCPDVPQFKQGANERGVVNRIVGAWQRNDSPISVWRRTDGSLQVISGRHRLDACTDADINCTVYEEGDRFNLDWARRHDVENNIRDGQASAFEIARYVRDSSLSMAEAVERGIARKGASLKGVELGLYASRELLDALGNGLVSADDAYRVALAFRNDAEVQRSGLAVLLDGGSFNEAYSVMTVRANMERIRAVAEAGGMTFETDLFGNSNADAYLRKLAEYATRKQRELSSELSAISGAARKPEVARRYGVNVKDKAALDALIKEMREKARRWKNFGIHEDLLREANDAVMVEMGLKSREDVDRENGVLPLEEPAQDQEEDSAAQGTLMLSRDVSRMLDAARKMGTIPAEGGTPVTNFSIVSIPSGDVVTTAADMRARLKPLQGRVFTNKNTGIQAVIEARVSGKTVGKAQQAQMSVANLKALGFSAEEARKIHYTAATRIHELFENAEDGIFEDSYKDDPSRAGAYHFFNTVDIEGIGNFDVNVTAIAHTQKDQSNTLYTLELTIENPSDNDKSHTLSLGGSLPEASGVSTRNLSSYRSFVEKEKASIKKKALADGTFMKAPNGADTNLTEDQWLSVRTEAFKRWFGDWEHDPENASKVVGKNGEPLVVYHGTRHRGFTVFEKSMMRSGGAKKNKGKNLYGDGFYFASDYYTAQNYGSNILECFLNIRNPAPNDLMSGAENDGIRGSVPGSVIFVAFDSTQIKSATNNRGTYYPENPDITFSIISANEQGLFRDGHFEADNAVITEPGVTFSITALHASHHSFRKFSTDFMGKGEGVQMYGWGLYFAQNPEVNREYIIQFEHDQATWKFKDLKTSSMTGMVNGLLDNIKSSKGEDREASVATITIMYWALGRLADARGDKAKIEVIKNKLREDIQSGKKDLDNEVCQFLIDHLEDMEVSVGIPSNYRVELNADNSVLMDWDYVDEAILALLKDSPTEAVRNALEYAKERADYRSENVSGKGVYKALFDAFWDGGDDTRQEAKREASQALLEAGIKGIRYADELSSGKAKEEQTYNYVIFDGNDIKITAFADESTRGEWVDYTDLTATFSIIGEKAESFLDYHNNGLSYTDPADGKRKAIIDSRGVRLKKERMGLSEGGHVNVSLAAALDFPELFRAYPQLRKLRVDFYRDGKSTTGGFTDKRENYIAVNVARNGKLAEHGLLLDTILHEVQHVIQGYEGFAMGAGNMDQESALAYLDASIAGLHGRDDAWARAARPRLKSMRADAASGVLDPALIYFFSHGEQEARLAGRFSENGTGVVMSGLNGFRLLDKPAFTVPLTGNITELGGITFGAGRFGRLADRILSPNGDWLYDEMVFKMRAATQRAVTKLDLYHAGNREAGLEMIAECQELISTVERYLPHTYGFGLEPYKIWLNVFSLLYGGGRRGDAAQDIVRNALEAIPMSKWPEIMEGSFIKNFVKWAENRPELEEVIEEARREIAERQSDYELDSSPDADNKAARAARKGVEQEVWHKLFLEYGTEFLEEYGEQKVYRLIGKFMSRVVEQIDRYRKDRTLGRIRRVVASVAPRTNPKGKPMLGKMDAETYRKLEKCMRLLEMTESQYDEFFQKNFPEDAEEGKRWEDLSPDALVQVTLPDAEGRLEEVTVTQREFETYACYERMDVNTAEKCGAALGEFISTSRHAWENAVEKKKLEIAAMAAPVLQATGELDDNRMAKFRRKARLRALPKKPLSLFDYLMNFNQYMQALSSVEPFAAIARQFDKRASRFNVQRQASEKDMLRFVHNAVAEIVESADRYDIAEWIHEGRMKEDTGISVVEREPDWNKKANTLYRERLLHLLRRKVKSHGLEAVQLYLGEFKLSEGLKKEVDALFGHRRKEISAKQAEKAREHMESVFTQKEWERYGEQDVFVRERAGMLRSKTKYARERYQPKSYRLDGLSRMEAAYLVLLSEQTDYTEALAERGFDAVVMDQLREFAGDEVMRFAYALREKLNERSGKVQEVTEKRYGTPFPLADNYFRAFFDVTMEAIDKSIADAASYGEAATGGKYGMIHARRQHKAHLDLEMDVCTAFMAAMTEQDLYLYGSEISRDLRALLNFKGEAGEAGRSLEVLLGRDAVGKLMAWADAFDRAGAESIRGHLDMNRLMNRLSGAAARVLLSGRVGTLTKQVTTVINAMYASDEISLSEWLGAVRRYHAGKLVKSVREMAALPELDSRDKSQFSATLTAMGADEAGRRVSRLERWNREGMDLLERVDMKGNTISAAILYDAVYRKAKRETPDATEAELDAVAMAEVRRSLSRKGQPMTQLQKSLAAQHRTWMQVGMLFLGGESINTIGNVFSLARSGQWGKAGMMWVSHGMVLAILNGLLNFATDDEKRRRKREWWHALFDVVMGPVMGIPVVSGLAGEGVRQLAKLCGYNAFMPGNNLLVPFSNAADIGKAFSHAWKVFDGKERPWEDGALSFHELLRTAAVGTAAFSPRTTKGGAAAVGAALTMAALLNVTEFALKTVRSVQENGADWDKWTGR